MERLGTERGRNRMEQLRITDTPAGPISYLLTRKRVKNLNLRVRNGQVSLSMPLGCPAEEADAMVRANGARCAVFAGQDGAWHYAMADPSGDLRGLVKRLNAALQGRGGGKPGFVQGSLAASRTDIEAFFTAESCSMPDPA